MPRKLTDWLASFLEYAESSEAPNECLYWTGVVTIAGAMRRAVWVDMGNFTFCCNHYVVMVAPPGVIGKTTTADLGLNLLRDVPGIHFGPDVVTWQALTQALAEKRIASDMGGGEMFPHCSLTMASGEMGNLIDPQDRQMLDLYVSLWDARAGTFTKVTKTSGTDQIVNPWINMIACTTPAWIAGTFPEYAIGGGFTSRCVFVFADKKRQLVAYPSKSMSPARLVLRRNLIHDLEEISKLRGTFTLTPEAFAWGEEWYHRHHTNFNKDIDPVRFGGYYSRKQGHIHKLGMIITASRGDSMRIEASVLREAERIVTGTEVNMHRVFELIGRSNDAKIASTVLELLARKGPILRSEVHAQLVHRFGSDELTRGITTLLNAGLIHMDQTGDAVKLLLRVPSDDVG